MAGSGNPKNKRRPRGLRLHPIKRAKKVELVVAEARKFPLILDKKSYLLIKIDFGKMELAVGRCATNHLLTHEFRGKTAKQLSKAVIASGLLTRMDHAAYLGRELARAEVAMRQPKNRKLKYIQDAA
ncbi:MAG: DUF4346 domain-containing protein [archaeon]